MRIKYHNKYTLEQLQEYDISTLATINTIYQGFDNIIQRIKES